MSKALAKGFAHVLSGIIGWEQCYRSNSGGEKVVSTPKKKRKIDQ